jgi:hypothetical protein
MPVISITCVDFTAKFGFDYLDDPEGVREHLFPDGLIAWSLAADVLAVGGAS